MVRRNLLLNSIFAFTIRCRSFRITWHNKRGKKIIYFLKLLHFCSLYSIFPFSVLSMVVSRLCNFLRPVRVGKMKIEFKYFEIFQSFWEAFLKKFNSFN
jgi:hypothetical protein